MHLADTIFVLCLFNPSIDCTLLSHILKYNYLLNIHNNPPPWKKIWHETKILLLRSTFMKSFMICMCSIWKLRKRCRFTVWPGDMTARECFPEWLNTPWEAGVSDKSTRIFTQNAQWPSVHSKYISSYSERNPSTFMCGESLCWTVKHWIWIPPPSSPVEWVLKADSKWDIKC